MPVSIIQWLNSNRDYTTGVDLFEKYGNNPTLLKLFRDNKNSFWEESLLSELQLIQKSDTKAIKTHSGPISPSQPRKTTERGKLPENAPKIIKDLVKEQSDLYAAAKSAHGQLKTSRSVRFRQELATHLVKYQERVKEIWQLRDYWEETGQLTSELQPRPAADLFKRISNVKNYIIKHRKANNQDKVKHYELELSKLDLELKILNEQTV